MNSPIENVRMPNVFDYMAQLAEIRAFPGLRIETWGTRMNWLMDKVQCFSAAEAIFASASEITRRASV
jgi:hypothetical protein